MDMKTQPQRRGLYKRVQSLRKNQTEPDPEVPGLRYVARETKRGTIRQYGQFTSIPWREGGKR